MTTEIPVNTDPIIEPRKNPTPKSEPAPHFYDAKTYKQKQEEIPTWHVTSKQFLIGVLLIMVTWAVIGFTLPKDKAHEAISTIISSDEGIARVQGDVREYAKRSVDAYSVLDKIGAGRYYARYKVEIVDGTTTITDLRFKPVTITQNESTNQESAPSTDSGVTE